MLNANSQRIQHVTQQFAFSNLHFFYMCAVNGS